MPKNNISTQLEEAEDSFDFSDLMGSPGDDMIADMLGHLIEASHRQMSIAVELTKLVFKNSTGEINEEKVFATFKRASIVVADAAPMKELWAGALDDVVG